MRDHGIPMDGLMSGAVRVLVVDSDEDVRQTLARILQDQTNYEVSFCQQLLQGRY